MFLLLFFVAILSSHRLQAAIQRLSPISIAEQTSIGTSIFDLNRLYASTDIRFSFLSDSSPHNVFFMIDSLTGRISIKRLIDREELCQSHVCQCERCVLTLEMIAAAERIDILSLDVLIENINDHRPTFPVAKFEIRLAETTEIGHVASFPAATDLDFQDQLKYRFVSFDNDEEIRQTFSIVQLQTENQLGLRLEKPLDRERRNLYRMKIEATDGENAAHLLLDVQILDSNDHVPQFEREQYQIRVPEDTPVGSSILRVHAQDLDDGLNSLINYSIVNTSPARQFPFTIHFDTGVIELVHPLDYEHETNYRFNVRARDHGADAISVYSQIQIDILDVNDCPPEIEFILPDQQQSEKDLFALEEEREIGTRLFHVSVSDKDALNERINLKLLNYDEFFQLNEQYNDLYSLIVRKRLDREQQEEFRLIFEAKDYDGRNVSLTSQKQITIRLTDINDCAPRLRPFPTPITVNENNPPNIQLFQFHGEDLDAANSSNSRLSYSLLPSNDSRFFILDRQFGILSIGEISFDYETKSRYHLILNVSDHGVHPRRLETLEKLIISINDLNDNAPQFEQPAYRFHLMENCSVGTPIGRVKANDRDSNATIIYEFNDDDDDDDETTNFELDRLTGQLFSKATVDFESQSIFHFSIVARDDDDLHSTQVNVTVQLIDINDHSPIVETPTSVYVSSETLRTNGSERLVVTHVMAKDDDEGMNGNLTYEILHGNRNDFFSIDRTNGTISAAAQRLAHGYHRLIINVCDQGNLSRHCSIGTINIKVGENVDQRFYSTSPFDHEVLAQKTLPDYKHVFTREMIFVIFISSLLTIVFLISIGIFCACFRQQKKHQRDLLLTKSSSNNVSNSDEQLIANDLRAERSITSTLSR